MSKENTFSVFRVCSAQHRQRSEFCSSRHVLPRVPFSGIRREEQKCEKKRVNRNTVNMKTGARRAAKSRADSRVPLPITRITMRGTPLSSTRGFMRALAACGLRVDRGSRDGRCGCALRPRPHAPRGARPTRTPLTRVAASTLQHSHKSVCVFQERHRADAAE